MADRSSDQYKKWSEHRLLSGILTILQNWFDRVVVNSVARLVEIQGLINDTDLRTAQIDASTHAITTIDHEHHQMHEGNEFFHEWFIGVNADDVLDIRFVTPAGDRRLHWAIEYTTEANFEMTFYEDIDITVAGASLVAQNNDRNSLNASILTDFDYILNINVANADTDTDITAADIIAIGATGSGRSQSGATFGRGGEIILREDTGYCLRFENQTNAAKFVDWKMEWYEHLPKD